MKWFKRVTITLIIAILLAVLALPFLLQTKLVRNYGKEIGLAYAHAYLNTRFSVEEIKGNLFNEIELVNVTMQLNSTEMASFKTISIYYSPWKLLNAIIEVDSVKIDGGRVAAIVYADSTWNFEHIYTSIPDTTHKTDTIPSTLKVNINHVTLSNIAISSKTPYPLMPQHITIDTIEGAFKWHSGYWGVTLEKSRLKAINPSITIKNVHFLLESKSDTLSLKHFALITDSNFVQTNGYYSNIFSFGAKAWGNPLNTNELQFILPSITFAQKPEFEIKVKGTDQEINLDVCAKQKQEVISANLSIPQNKNTKNTLPAKLTFTLNNIKLASWGIYPDTLLTLNGSADVTTKNITQLNDTIHFNLNLNNSRYQQYTILQSEIKGNFCAKNGKALVKITLPQMQIKGLVNAYSIGSDNLVTFNGEYKNLELKSLNYGVPYTTNLNGRIKFKGHFPAKNGYKMEAISDLSPSLADALPIDTGHVEVRLQNDSVLVDTARIMVASTSLKTNGYATFGARYHFYYNLGGEINQLLKFYLKPEYNPSGAITMNGSVWGEAAHVNGSTNVTITNFSLDSVLLNESKAKFEWVYLNKFNVNSYQASIKNINAYGIHLDTLNSNGGFINDSLTAHLNFGTKDLVDVFINLGAQFNDTSTIVLKEYEISMPKALFYNKQEKTTIKLSPTGLFIDDLSLLNRYNSEFRLQLKGNISLIDPLDFKIAIKHLNLENWTSILSSKRVAIKGWLNSNATISGKFTNPNITAELNMDSVATNGLMFENIDSKLNFCKGEIALQTQIVTQFYDSLFLNAKAPLTLSADTSTFKMAFPGQIEGQLYSKNIAIGNFLAKETSGTKIDGNLSFDTHFNGHYNHLKFKGFTQLSNGFIKDIKRGIFYNDIFTRLSIDGNKINLDSLKINEGKGILSAYGWAVLDSTKNGLFKDADINLKTNSFGVVRSKMAEVVMNGHLNLKKSNNMPTFDGEFDIIRSSFFIPALMESNYTNENDRPSILLTALEKQQKDTTITFKTIIKRDTVRNEIYDRFMNNLTGNLKIVMPKNNWLKNENSKIELNGVLNVVKRNPYFEILGKIEVTRGQLYVYGRKFTITTGNIDFQGGKSINPLLNISTEYVFRTPDEQKKTLVLKVSDFLELPTIDYTLDGKTISASDAYSYIIFGQSLNEIGAGSADLAGSISADMVSKIVSNQLSQTIGSSLNLDIIELNYNSSFNDAAFTVGKYITPDLFITYQQGFANTTNDDSNPDQFTMEYEFKKNFFFRLQSGAARTSGVDLIIKFER